MFWEHVLNSVCTSGASSFVPLQMFRGIETNYGKKKKAEVRSCNAHDNRNEVLNLSSRADSRGRDSMLKQEVFKLLKWCWFFSLTWGKSHLLGKNA